MKWYGRADGLLTDVLGRAPADAAAAHYLANTLTSRMSVLHNLKRYADERRDCQRAIEVTTGDRHEAFQAKLAELQSLTDTERRAADNPPAPDSPPPEDPVPPSPDRPAGRPGP